MRHLLFVILVLAPTLFLWAEEPDPYAVYDSIFLEEIVTYADYNKYQAGAKIESLLPEQVSSVQEGGIEQLLMRFTPIYVKSNAGGLATIHIRGTAPDHTSIMFGGININSLTLGHSDLSSITSFLFDKLEIQYGSSAALNGSGAIGGALYLGGHNYWTNGFRLNAKYSLGSFGEHTFGAKVYFGNGKWESVTKLIQYKTENDFTYINYEGFGNENGRKEAQQGASVNNKGIIQEFNYLFGANEYFKSMIWYTDSWHEIQPSIGDAQEIVNEIEDNNLRFWSEYRNENRQLKYALGAGFAHDKQLYNNDPAQLIQTDRLITDLSIKHKIHKKIEFKAGIKYKYIVPDVYSYSDSADINEHKADIYLTSFYRLIENLTTTINLRQQLVSNFKAPFTPAFGIEYNWLKPHRNQLKTLINISKSYRVPTLNDRFWPTSQNPKGTPDLKPENGMSWETGIEYNLKKKNVQAEVKANFFYMDIKNWLEWRNDNGPVPKNLEKVISKGIELHASATATTGNFVSTINGNYTYNPSLKIEANKPTQQLIYIPKHMLNTYYSIKYKTFSLLVDGSFTGERFYYYTSKTTQLRRTLDSYFLTNCMLKYQFEIAEQQFIASASVNNIFNVNYQNQKNYAMPGTNFRLGITTNINY